MFNIKPTLQEIKEKLVDKSGKILVPVWTEIIADLETPVSAYNKVCKDKKYGFLLESAEGGESFGRYSFIGIDPLFILKSEDNKSVIFDFLENKPLMESSDPYELFKSFFKEFSVLEFDIPSLSGAVGYFGFDTIRYIEPKLNKSYEKIEKCQSFPDAYFMISGNTLAFDHVNHKIYIISNMVVENIADLEESYNKAAEKISKILQNLSSNHNLQPLSLSLEPNHEKVSSNITKEEWIEAINSAKEHIVVGDIFQVVLSQRFQINKGNLDNFTIYRALRSINPSPYLYFLNFDDFQIIGSSPEALVKCSKDKIVSTRPIAGTRKRGNTKERDKDLEIELLADPKERAEHVMLVDLARNDIGRVCEYGSVKVDRFMEVERFSHVMHIVSDVSGKLRDEFCSIDLLKACFPAGTVSGAPKVRAMEIIYDLEKSARGPYGGCIGYLGFNDEVNVAITLRTMLIKDNNIFIQAGGGIVADSDPELEYLESQNKAAALVQAVKQLQ
ncbi:MAG TPA: anthranilate synthase component I [Cyanobacteria bacterium UBA9971]|nr:anthranilate synthase component I [Cyanobacteria bacterium UBA9971]